MDGGLAHVDRDSGWEQLCLGTLVIQGSTPLSLLATNLISKIKHLVVQDLKVRQSNLVLDHHPVDPVLFEIFFGKVVHLMTLWDTVVALGHDVVDLFGETTVTIHVLT